MPSTWALISTIAAFASVSCKEVEIKNEECRHCEFLAATFQAGMEKTANKHFAGGDTAWEEKNLGKYATSETRLVEVMEGVCKKRTLDSTDKFSGLLELEFKCSARLEESEELVEEWYRKEQAATSLFSFLCIDRLKLCCPESRFGPLCAECPGVAQGAAACYGKGNCHGDRSRKGTGKCVCDKGYVGHACSNCDNNYFAITKTDKEIDCQECHESCVGGCSEAGPKGCTNCRSGWTKHPEEGCQDVDECTAELSPCSGPHQKCVNTLGSFRCDCEEGYVKNTESAECELDIAAPSSAPWLPAYLFLRLVAYSGLASVVALVYSSSHYRSHCSIFLTILAIIISVLIELFVNPDSIPDLAKNILGAI